MLHGLVVAGLLLGLAGTAAADPPGDAAASQPFFAATLDDTQHQQVRLADLRGKPLVVNFWATWCIPCRAEIPALSDAYARNRARGIGMLGVAVEDDAGVVGDFVSAHEVGYPVLIGKEQGMALMRQLGNDRTAVPFTVAIDAAGRIVARKIGILRRGDLERMLASLRAPGAGDDIALRY